MRVALIAIDGQPRLADEQGPVLVGGRALALRQLDFALAAGAERIIGLGHGATAEAVALRLASEAAGVRFQVASGVEGLLGTVGTADDLLVFMPGLLPEARDALAALEQGFGVLTLPESVIAQGFERIDRERAWAGAARVPGNLIERLSDLASDVAIPSVLMRLALQTRVPEQPLDPAAVAAGGWVLVDAGDSTDEAAYELTWLKRNMPVPPDHSLSGRLAMAALRSAARPILRSRRTPMLWTYGAVLLLLAAVGLAALGPATWSFALLTAAVVLGAFGEGAVRLRAAPFGAVSGQGWFALATDAALVAVIALGIAGGLVHRLFPALVLLAVFYLPGRFPASVRWAEDRLTLALALLLAAMAGYLGSAVAVLALIGLALHLDRTRLTQN